MQASSSVRAAAAAHAPPRTRVAVFTDNDFGKVNGVTTTLRAVLRFAPPDLGVRIYTADDHGVDDDQYLALRSWGAGIPYYREMKIYLPHVGAYLRRAREEGVGLVHMTTPGPVGLAGLYVASRLRVPVVGSFHTDLARYAELLSGSKRLGAVVGQYLRWPYGRCDRVFVPSQATADALSDARVAPGRHAIWRRGVDTSLFSPDRRSQALREQWGADDHTPVVMYLGRISREKNLAAFYALRARLEGEGLRHRLVLVGDGPMRAELEQMPGAILTGTVPHDEVGTFLASADVFAFPSLTDTAGNVVLEAQASGVPVVVSDRGGPSENLWPGQSGFVVDGQSTDAFAAAVVALVRDAGGRADMAATARRFALTRDWPAALDPLFSGYRDLTRPASLAAAHGSVLGLEGRA